MAAKNKTGRFGLTTFTPNSTVFSANDWHNSEDSTKRGHTEFLMMFDRLIDRKTVRGTESAAIMFFFPPLSNFPLSSKKKRGSTNLALFFTIRICYFIPSRSSEADTQTRGRSLLRNIRIQLVGFQVWISIPGEILKIRKPFSRWRRSTRINSFPFVRLFSIRESFLENRKWSSSLQGFRML